MQETQKFRSELRKKLAKDRETFGDEMDTVVKICAEVMLLSDAKRSVFYEYSVVLSRMIHVISWED